MNFKSKYYIKDMAIQTIADFDNIKTMAGKTLKIKKPKAVELHITAITDFVNFSEADNLILIDKNDIASMFERKTCECGREHMVLKDEVMSELVVDKL